MLATLILSLLSFTPTDTHIGRYEVTIQTVDNERYHAYITVVAESTLQTDFASDEVFMNYLFNVGPHASVDTLPFFTNFHQLTYPMYKTGDWPDPVIAVLEEDKLRLAKSQITTISFLSFRVRRTVGLVQTLTIDDIELLQTHPEFTAICRIDEDIEQSRHVWVIAYNSSYQAGRVSETVEQIRSDYNVARKAGRHPDLWHYERILARWHRELKEKGVYLLQVVTDDVIRW